jgi:ABC-type transporter Mla subunit MlaD
LKRLRIFAFVLSIAVFLTGCRSDEKLAADISKSMKESAQFENDFYVNLTNLSETRQNAQLIYLDLIKLDINDQDIIKQKIDKAKTYSQKQQQLLEEATENFEKAYMKAASIGENIKKINDKDQKKQAEKLLAIMNERKKLIDSFFEHYYENLKLQNSFYRNLEDEKYSLVSLNEQINEINKLSGDMGEIIEQFNQYTKQYVKVEKDFYEMNS